MNFPAGYQIQNSIVRTPFLQQPKRAVWSIPLKRQTDTESIQHILASTIPELAASSLILISQIVYRILFLTIYGLSIMFLCKKSLNKVSWFYSSFSFAYEQDTPTFVSHEYVAYKVQLQFSMEV